ncbi:hypothetical protein Z517_09269 [Fonsecaea pedrosoi CBS 271.37]|uniref:Uncharacterized protein n=1 Tax=Fonsecaea pedrosoi CBS 271.37 TaxID=1442368 RepID=A0A0D2GDS4_9EURO|nr:uncharacterized protein Z517_09269 [Fonsecaea pedrosoi CBS 271.37]KIW76825.1 hypothetical protein Z517_09269 [Fonsecaea pedrosoi CBS 271.37]
MSDITGRIDYSICIHDKPQLLYFNLGGGTDDSTKHKVAFLHSGIGVNLIILEPELCMTTPPHHWLSTGVRSLDHCVEALCSLQGTETSDRNAEEGLNKWKDFGAEKEVKHFINGPSGNVEETRLEEGSSHSRTRFERKMRTQQAARQPKALETFAGCPSSRIFRRPPSLPGSLCIRTHVDVHEKESNDELVRVDIKISADGGASAGPDKVHAVMNLLGHSLQPFLAVPSRAQSTLAQTLQGACHGGQVIWDAKTVQDCHQSMVKLDAIINMGDGRGHAHGPARLQVRYDARGDRQIPEAAEAPERQDWILVEHIHFHGQHAKVRLIRVQRYPSVGRKAFEGGIWASTSISMGQHGDARLLQVQRYPLVGRKALERCIGPEGMMYSDELVGPTLPGSYSEASKQARKQAKPS